MTLYDTDKIRQALKAADHAEELVTADSSRPICLLRGPERNRIPSTHHVIRDCFEYFEFWSEDVRGLKALCISLSFNGWMGLQE
jgi:hypothetical protein